VTDIILRIWSAAIWLSAVAMVVLVSCSISAAEPNASTGDDKGQEFIDVVEFEGVVRAARAADVSPRFDGLVKTINFRAGDIIKKGQLLVQLLTLEQDYLLKSDKANLARAAAELKLAEAELERSRVLQKKDIASKAQLDVAEAKRDVAAANHASAATQVEMREIIIREFSLYAPFDGIISEPFVNEGAYITKEARDASRLATVTQLDPIHVVTEVPYSIYASRHARLGSEEAMTERIVARLILPDGTEYLHQGKIVSGAFAFDEKTQKISSIAEFPNPDRLLRPGLRVTVRSMIRQVPQ
jgi:RND family efflux transporter MFP subunit